MPSSSSRARKPNRTPSTFTIRDSTKEAFRLPSKEEKEAPKIIREGYFTYTLLPFKAERENLGRIKLKCVECSYETKDNWPLHTSNIMNYYK